MQGLNTPPPPPPRGCVSWGGRSDEGVAIINLWPGPGSVVVVMLVNVIVVISSKLVFLGTWGPEYFHCHLVSDYHQGPNINCLAGSAVIWVRNLK